MKRYSEDHLWVDVTKGGAKVGITAYAADELGEITFIELPEEGIVLTQGDTLCVLESVKAAQDVIAPLSGTIAKVNARLDEEPELLSSASESEGWICQLTEIENEEVRELMTEEEYEAYTAGGAEDIEEEDREDE